MRRVFWMLLITGVVCVFSGGIVLAQPGGGPPPNGEDGDGPPPPPRRGGRRGPPPNPILQALDTNHDQELSAEEIANAAAALKKLDKNGDGKLTHDELRPQGMPGDRGPGGRRGGRGPDDQYGGRSDRGGPDDDGPAGEGRSFRRGPGFGPPDQDGPPDGPGRFGRGRGPGGNGPRGGLNPQRMVQHAMEFDSDDDGKLNREELTAFAQECARHESENGGPRGRGPGGNGPGGNRPGANGPAGGLNPQQMVQHALKFDKDGDGKLSRQEFMGFAKESARHAARGGPGGRGGDGGPGGGGPGGRGGDGGPGGPPPGGGPDDR